MSRTLLEGTLHKRTIAAYMFTFNFLYTFNSLNNFMTFRYTYKALGVLEPFKGSYSVIGKNTLGFFVSEETNFSRM
jgi:hypothetical protein